MSLKLVFAAIIGIVGGTLSGLLGIGGGVIFVPSIIYFFGASIDVAIGTSLAIMIPQVISGSLTHFFNQNVNLKIALLMAIGAIIGAYIGANLEEVFSENLLKRIFALLLTFVAVKVFLETV